MIDSRLRKNGAAGARTTAGIDFAPRSLVTTRDRIRKLFAHVLRSNRMKALLCSVAIIALLHVAAPLTHAADQYKVDAIHSSVVFRIKHMGVSYCYGRFNDVSGVFHLDEQNPLASEIDVTVATECVDTANAQRDAHLRNADFLDAPKPPTIRFQATKVGRTGAGQFAVEGNLTMHGVTRSIAVEIEPTGAGKGDVRRNAQWNRSSFLQSAVAISAWIRWPMPSATMFV
jgi:polyisoprenoid-binding protein YceI